MLHTLLPLSVLPVILGSILFGNSTYFTFGPMGYYWKIWKITYGISQQEKKVPICIWNGNTAAETKVLHICIFSMMNYFILATCIFIFDACVLVNNSLHYHFIMM